MNPPRPLTPQRAKQICDRWRWVSLAALAATVVGMIAVGADWPVLCALVAALAGSESASYSGWRTGWQARERAGQETS